MPSVLLTCSGQRVDIVRAFRAAIDRLGGGTVVCCDAHPLSPTLHVGEAGERVPPIASDEYIPALAELVARHEVLAVLPLADLDAAELAAGRDRLEAAGARLFLPPEPVAGAMFDKYACHQLLVERGIGSPDTWLPDDVPADLHYPVLVKRRWGYASRDIHRCDSREELDFFLRYVKVPAIVQQLCAGEEFSLDALSDLDGACVNVIPRTMIESKGGESIKGMTLADPRLIEYGRAVAEQLGLVGPATIQCFDQDEALLVTDINARFGGGFPLPLAAGSNYPELIMRLAAGERVEPHVGRFRAGVVMTRYFDALTLTEPPPGARELSVPSASAIAAR